MIYQQLLAPERKLLHQRVGEAMEDFYASDLTPFLSQLATHFHLAHDWTRTMAYATQASQRAQAVHATVEALEQVDRAVEAASHLGRDISSEVIGSLHHQRGQLRAVLGQFEPARQDLEDALASAQRTNAAGFHWQTLLDLGTLWAGHKDYGRAQIYFQRALEMSRTQDNRGQMAHSLNAIGNLVLNQRRLAEALDTHQQALAIFTELDDRRGKAQTLDYLSMAALMVGDVVEKDTFCRQAAELFPQMLTRTTTISRSYSRVERRIGRMRRVPSRMPAIASGCHCSKVNPHGMMAKSSPSLPCRSQVRTKHRSGQASRSRNNSRAPGRVA